MSTMAEVIAAHVFDSVGRICSCGTLCGVACDNLTYAEHVAAELAKAGYGNMADAWDEGQKSGMRHADRVIAAHKIGRPELPGPPSTNPYRGAGHE